MVGNNLVYEPGHLDSSQKMLLKMLKVEECPVNFTGKGFYQLTSAGIEVDDPETSHHIYNVMSKNKMIRSYGMHLCFIFEILDRKKKKEASRVQLMMEVQKQSVMKSLSRLAV
jgi:hypothetical protein